MEGILVLHVEIKCQRSFMHACKMQKHVFTVALIGRGLSDESFFVATNMSLECFFASLRYIASDLSLTWSLSNPLTCCSILTHACISRKSYGARILVTLHGGHSHVLCGLWPHTPLQFCHSHPDGRAERQTNRSVVSKISSMVSLKSVISEQA